MRMAEEKVCKLKCNKKLFIINYEGDWVRELLPFRWVGWWQLLDRKNQFLLSVCHFAVKLL